MPTDQNHEQVNKDLKGSGGFSDLLNTTGSLERFLVSGLWAHCFSAHQRFRGFRQGH